jgi:hypothetical protein
MRFLYVLQLSDTYQIFISPGNLLSFLNNVHSFTFNSFRCFVLYSLCVVVCVALCSACCLSVCDIFIFVLCLIVVLMPPVKIHLKFN